jgi:hypothetical protein
MPLAGHPAAASRHVTAPTDATLIASAATSKRVTASAIATAASRSIVDSDPPVSTGTLPFGSVPFGSLVGGSVGVVDVTGSVPVVVAIVVVMSELVVVGNTEPSVLAAESESLPQAVATMVIESTTGTHLRTWEVDICPGYVGPTTERSRVPGRRAGLGRRIRWRAVTVWYVIVGVAGALVVMSTLLSAIQTVIVPRANATRISRITFIGLRRLMDLIAPARRSFAFRDRVMSLYAPLGLVMLPGAWIVLVTLGFGMMQWATGVRPLVDAIFTSGSSVTTLGLIRPEGTDRLAFAVLEAIIGLGLVSLMISYLPTIYSAFNRRETLVGMLEVRAGLPSSPQVLLTRYQRIGWLDAVDVELFPVWEGWFADIEESHTSQSSLVFFRSPQPGRSWITAAGCVLDTAAIVASAFDRPTSGQAAVLLRSGFMSLRRIADFFGIVYDENPEPTDPISIERSEFDELCDSLSAAGIPLKADRDQAWLDYRGWRVNYDAVLLALCALVMAPPAPWSSDRMPTRRPRPRLLRVNRAAR